ncbi:MAG: MBL fold metallo-hydrolase [Tildeniella nuda ZEHNDER 1965/U140]|jgi:phosphoribosyl 1,2-cyclic phosphodiesterase|nr:MBL fold metallo-hydrolase [Tildeniella nuda ZEHNDER 1965/U140]
MHVKLWGTRGSLPTPQAPEQIEARIKGLFQGFFAAGHQQASEVDDYLAKLPADRFGGYGGETLCVEVSTSQQRLIIDGGSGMRSLGYELAKGASGHGQGELHILFTHFHWDHLSGLPFFLPLFIPGNKIHVYAVQPDLPEVFRTLFKKPYFPVPLEKIDAEIEYHQLMPRQPVTFDDLTVTPYQLDHPDPCWGYRFEAGGKVLSYCVDNEIQRVSREDLGLDLPLYQNVDLMIIDAQYTLLEATEKINWGHGAAPDGLEIAMREGIKQVLFVHHDPAASDAKVAAAEWQARCFYEKQLQMIHRSPHKLHELTWSFARDGMTIAL